MPVREAGPSLVGKKFGRLTVDAYDESASTKRVYYRCVCDCGVQKLVAKGELTKGAVVSCGCYRREHMAELGARGRRFTKEDSQWRTLLRDYEAGARNRGLAFELTHEQVRAVCSMPCHYCGTDPMDRWVKRSRHPDPIKANGIDRVDNNRGYEMDNIVPCCWHCNKMKMDTSYQDFINRAVAIASRHGGVSFQ